MTTRHYCGLTGSVDNPHIEPYATGELRCNEEYYRNRKSFTDYWRLILAIEAVISLFVWLLWRA